MISQVLKSDIDSYAAHVRETSTLLARARAGTLPVSAVGKYFASIHYLLTQTPVHLALAEERARELGAKDLARYFETKSKEERDHHEWAEADRRRLGEVFGDDIARAVPAKSILELMAQTRTAIGEDPYSYLAYILFAEYFTVVLGPEWLAALETGCGIPPRAMTSIANHVELDKAHVLEGCREIDFIVKDTGRDASLRRLLSATFARFTSFCEEVDAA
jgi:hypothetical protein